MLLTERRTARRYPLECDLLYTTLHKRKPMIHGTGKTLNISSSGVAFTSDQVLQVGTLLQLSIHWPLQRGERSALTLVVIGRVMRSAHHQSALKCDKLYFRLGNSDEANRLVYPSRVPRRA